MEVVWLGMWRCGRSGLVCGRLAECGGLELGRGRESMVVGGGSLVAVGGGSLVAVGVDGGLDDRERRG